ncbi:MAG TPA: S41 family peptidase [Longimicrobiales bacterium]|nr:S41 family peptidase [Longimicrobiales bacterium]
MFDSTIIGRPVRRRNHRPRRAAATAIAVGLALMAGAWPSVLNAQRPEARPSFAEPGISPDGREIAFVSGGDIWTVPVEGGVARLLVSDASHNSRPLFSPDGRRLAFVSDRTGNGDIYVLELATGELRRLTFDDGLDQLDGWSPDGRWIYYSSTSRDIAGMNDIYRIPADGGTPMPVAADRYVNEFFAAAAPDGSTLAISARGIASGQWWRRGHSHIDQSEIWLVRIGNGVAASNGGPAGASRFASAGAAPSYERVTDGKGKELWPMWGGDGRTLYYVSDRDGAANIWVLPADGEPRRLTRFTDGRVLWPSISRDGRIIAFERGLSIWTLDTATGEAREVPITLRGAPATTPAERLRLTAGFSDLALSPDGKKLAFVARGEIFAASAQDGGDAVRVTHTAAAEFQPVWAPDSRRLAYVSARDGVPNLYLYDFTTGEERRLTSSTVGDHSPVFSPDGASIAFVRGGRELRVLDVASGRERVLATGSFGQPPILSPRSHAWSPDGQWIAFLAPGEKSFTNIHLVPAAGGEARPVSWVSNVFGSAVAWSPDGKQVMFNTRQRTEEGVIARVDLVPRTPVFREDRFRDLFREETPRGASRSGASGDVAAARSPARGTSAAQADARRPERIEWEGLRRRMEVLPIGLDIGYYTLSPDGKTLVAVASVAGRSNLYAYSLDETASQPAVPRQLTSTPGGKSGVQFSPDGKTIYYLDGGRIHTVPLDGGQPRQVNVTAELVVDFDQEKHEVFRQAWSYLNDHFYDPDFHGVDWNAVREAYAPFVAGARSRPELRRALQLMVGELNASHLGVNPPGGSSSPSTGRLGLRFDRVEYESAGRLRVSEVIALGPADVAGVKVGEYLLAVDGAPVGQGVNLDSLLEYRIGRRVELRVAPTPDGRDARTVAVRPVNTSTEKGLLYRQWVEQNRAYVERESGGRLGYVHMPDMSWNSLLQLYLDLDAENHGKEGVIVDIRNNNGGFVNVYAIDVFARREYLIMTQRGAQPAPARTVLGQRALGTPTILVTNRHSLSDAEDFTEGYRAHGLGKVVGEPTAGWIIYTWNQPLIDGSVVRLPRMKVTDLAGNNMELAPRPVDVPVQRPVGESYTGRDSELDAAIRELLRQIDGMRADR